MLAAVGGVVVSVCEAALSCAVAKLSEFSFQRLGIPDEVQSSVERLQEELDFMYSFIKDAEEIQGGNNRMRSWVSMVTDIANETVSVLDEFQLKIASGDPTHLDRVRSLIARDSDIRDIGERIKSIFAKVDDLARRKKSYCIPNISSSSVGESSTSVAAKSLRRTTPYMDGADQLFVGLEDVKKELMGELLKEDFHRCIVSIYGIGGSGKTNLARSLYNSDEVLSHFPLRAWTYVSQEYTISDILRRVIKYLEKISGYDEKLEKMGEEDLECYLRDKLSNIKYLVVIDDVWDRVAWETLKRSFPDCANGSRVIVTTRNYEVATRMEKRIYAHHLRLLDPKESLELFLRKLCAGNENEWPVWCSLDMETLGREMVFKCRGLPLALVVLGGLLADKQSSREWLQVKEQIWLRLSQDSVEISHLFSLSYNDLPNELKKFFLYISTFPEDYLIFLRNLSCMWMAEEFRIGRLELENIAASHLNELANRNLIQVEPEIWGLEKGYKIHDLLRNLSIVKASEIKLFDIYNPIAKHDSLYVIRRHIVSTPNIQRYVTTAPCNTKLQSLIMYNNHGEKQLASPQLIARLEKFIDLSILKLVNFETPCELLNTIGNLPRLKYLRLVSTDDRVDLPPSIGNLMRLETLEVFGGPCNLPSEISKLKNLRHIVCKLIEGGVAGIKNLSNLQSLKFISYEHLEAIQTDNLVDLRLLGIIDITKQNGKVYSLESISMLKSLHTLMLQCSDKDTGFPPLEFLHSLQNLSILVLSGKINTLPPAEKWPKFLSALSLLGSQLGDDPIPTLEKLSNLKRLDIGGTHKTDMMSFSSKCLPQLEHLYLGYFPDLKKVEVGEGALPIIKRLYIFQCGELKDIPDQLKSISTQRNSYLFNFPSYF